MKKWFAVVSLFIIPFVSFGAIDYEATSNTRALYHLEDALDSSGNGFNLTNNNAALFVPAYFSNGGDLNASSSQYFSILNNLGVGGNVSTTFVLTYKPEIVPVSPQTLLNHYDDTADVGYYINYKNTGTPFLEFNRDRRGVTACSFTHNVTLSTGEFSNIILKWDAGTTELVAYLQGVGNIGSSTCSGNGSFADSTEFDIGVNTDGNSFAEGIIDEVIVEAGSWSSSTIDDYWQNYFLSSSTPTSSLPELSTSTPFTSFCVDTASGTYCYDSTDNYQLLLIDFVIVFMTATATAVGIWKISD